MKIKCLLGKHDWIEKKNARICMHCFKIEGIKDYLIITTRDKKSKQKQKK